MPDTVMGSPQTKKFEILVIGKNVTNAENCIHISNYRYPLFFTNNAAKG
jgi:hypothetical protein